MSFDFYNIESVHFASWHSNSIIIITRNVFCDNLFQIFIQSWVRLLLSATFWTLVRNFRIFATVPTDLLRIISQWMNCYAILNTKNDLNNEKGNNHQHLKLIWSMVHQSINIISLKKLSTFLFCSYCCCCFVLKKWKVPTAMASSMLSCSMSIFICL